MFDLPSDKRTDQTVLMDWEATQYVQPPRTQVDTRSCISQAARAPLESGENFCHYHLRTMASNTAIFG